MILFAAIQAVNVSPPLLFVGETFALRFEKSVSQFLETSDVVLNRRSGRVVGPRGKFLVRFSDGDATWVDLPVSTAARWAAWPSRSGEHSGVGFLIGSRKIAVVPTQNGVGLCVVQNEKESRYPFLVRLNVGVRSAPIHVRDFKPYYSYFGGHATLLGKPGDVCEVAVRIDNNGVSATVAALYRMRGTIEIMGRSHPLDLNAGSAAVYREDF